jgi:hypothetical protein
MSSVQLSDALRALPLEAPDASAWPALADRLAARPAPRAPWRRYGLAAAAVLALAVVLVRGGGDPVAPADAGADSLATLQAQSAQLERVLEAARGDGAGNAGALVMQLQLEDRLQSLDAELAKARLAPARRLELWRQRVDVLHAAAGIESSRRYYAARGQALEPTLVATY